MKSNAFTFQAKYADALKGLPEEAQAEFALAIINYGCYGEEPCFKTPYLYALFTLAREDIDYSVKSRANGSKGGSKSSKAKAGTPSEQQITPLAETDNTPCEVSATTLAEVSQHPLDENGNPIHSKAIHSKAKHKERGGARMARPTLQEVEAYIAEKGYNVDAAAFIAYYDSNGWKVGKNPMKSWKGALTTWERRDNPGGKGAGDADFSRFG